MKREKDNPGQRLGPEVEANTPGVFVGRETELLQMEAAVESMMVQNGARRAVFYDVLGFPGLGKDRLLDELKTRMEQKYGTNLAIVDISLDQTDHDPSNFMLKFLRGLDPEQEISQEFDEIINKFRELPLPISSTSDEGLQEKMQLLKAGFAKEINRIIDRRQVAGVATLIRNGNAVYPDDFLSTCALAVLNKSHKVVSFCALEKIQTWFSSDFRWDRKKLLLSGFSEEESEQLYTALAGPKEYTDIFKNMHYWTQGHPGMETFLIGVIKEMQAENKDVHELGLLKAVVEKYIMPKFLGDLSPACQQFALSASLLRTLEMNFIRSVVTAETDLGRPALGSESANEECLLEMRSADLVTWDFDTKFRMNEYIRLPLSGYFSAVLDPGLASRIHRQVIIDCRWPLDDRKVIEEIIVAEALFHALLFDASDTEFSVGVVINNFAYALQEISKEQSYVRKYKLDRLRNLVVEDPRLTHLAPLLYTPELEALVHSSDTNLG